MAPRIHLSKYEFRTVHEVPGNRQFAVLMADTGMPKEGDFESACGDGGGLVLRGTAVGMFKIQDFQPDRHCHKCYHVLTREPVK